MRRITYYLLGVALCGTFLSVYLWREVSLFRRSLSSLEMRLTGRPWKESEPLFGNASRQTGRFHYGGRDWTALYFPSGANGVDFLVVVDDNGLICATASEQHLQEGKFLEMAHQSLR